MARGYAEDLGYYHANAPQRQASFQEDIKTAFAVLQQLNLVAARNKQPELASEIETLLEQKMKAFE